MAEVTPAHLTYNPKIGRWESKGREMNCKFLINVLENRKI